jgi:predicted GNAT superfamily acetyltransferase
MKEIVIRNASRDDLEHLLELNQSNLPHVGSIKLSDMEHLHSQAIYFRVAELNGHATGFLIAFDPEADYTSPNFLWFKKRYAAFNG